MPIIVVCNVFQERKAFYGKCLLSLFVICFKIRMAFNGKSLLSSFVKVFQERPAFNGKCLLSSFVKCFKSVWHLTGNAYYRRL